MDQWDIETHLAPTRRKILAWLALYPFLWVALFMGSSMASFLPAGLRLATLWLLPRRWWWGMALVEWSAVFALSLWLDNYKSGLGMFVGVVLPWMIYAVSVNTFAADSRSAPSTKSLPRMLTCGLIASLFATIALTAVDLNDDGILAAEFATTILGYAIGDFAGSILVAPLVLMLFDQGSPQRQPWRHLFADGLVLLPLTVALALSTFHGLTAPLYQVVLSLLPMFVIAHRYGWRQGAIALALLAPAIPHFDDALVAAWGTGQFNVLAAVSGYAALLLGASNEHQREQRTRLTGIVQTLSLRTRQLTEAANRIASLQEQERRRIGVELHDQIGQDMTAIAIRLRIIEHRAIVPEVREGMAAIGRLVADAHVHLREVINELHPAVLDRFGLARAMADGPIAELLRYKNVDYACTILGDVEALPDSVASALYRVCQEAATNCAKHGCGGRVHISLTLESQADGYRVSLLIEDDAGAIEVDERRLGRGLQNIRDRAYAIGAEYGFNKQSGQPRHMLRLLVATAATAEA